MNIIETGQKAPEFCLVDYFNKPYKLSDYQKHWLVIFFYPKDNTPGCTKEACQFRDYYADILALDTKILGISTDSTKSHYRFTTKYQFPFPLLSDKTGEISRLYGTLFEYWFIRFCKRHSFIINPQGRLIKIYRKVNPTSHCQQIITDLKKLQENKAKPTK